MSQEYEQNELNIITIKNLIDDFDDYEYDDEEKGPALEIYGTDITLLARQGQLEECFGRERELLEMMEILVRRLLLRLHPHLWLFFYCWNSSVVVLFFLQRFVPID
jgi:ATP-dependent Clp protease ATP-binding subunit ClpA